MQTICVRSLIVMSGCNNAKHTSSSTSFGLSTTFTLHPKIGTTKNCTPGSTHGHQSWTPAVTQMGQPWDMLGFDPLTSYRADRWALGGRWGVESELTGGVGKRCGAGAMRWNSWHFRKVRTFADSARSSEWTRQLRVQCACAFLDFLTS